MKLENVVSRELRKPSLMGRGEEGGGGEFGEG